MVARQSSRSDDPSDVAKAISFGVESIHIRMMDDDRLKEMLRNPILGPPSSHRSPKTVEAENALDLPSSMYFYLGRAFPNPLGNFSVSIRFSEVSDATGWIAPFDTGSVHFSHTKLDWKSQGFESAKDYVHARKAEVSECPVRFKEHLSSFFKSCEDYWIGCPNLPIDGTTFQPNDDFRNWTFEVGLTNEISLDKSKVRISRELNKKLEMFELSGVLSSAEHATAMAFEVSDTPATDAENAARSTVSRISVGLSK